MSEKSKFANFELIYSFVNYLGINEKKRKKKNEIKMLKIQMNTMMAQMTFNLYDRSYYLIALVQLILLHINVASISCYQIGYCQ